MKIDRDKIKRILLITLTNIGDIILTTPLISVLEREFPGARLDVMVGPLGKDIFIRHPRVFKVIIYNKYLPLQDKRRLVLKLRNIKYDLVVDMKNSLLPILIGARYRTSPIRVAPKGIIHKKEFHLWKLKPLGIDAGDAPFSIYIDKKDSDYIEALLERIPNKENIIAISPGAKSLIKRWKKNGFAEVADKVIAELNMPVVMVGDQADKDIIDEVANNMKSKPCNLAGLTTIPQLASLLRRCRLLITNDSAPMHVGAAVGADVLAIFGPTDPRKYGPRGQNDRVIRKELACSPCEAAQCKYKHECMRLISADEVYHIAKEMIKRKV